VSPLPADLLVPPGHFGYLASLLLVGLVGLASGVGFIVALGRALSVAAWQRRASRAQRLQSSVLAEGPAVVVGEVAVAEADPPEPGVAIRVMLTQRVQAGVATEVARATQATPFYLATAGGEVVRVEPGPSPTLAASLERDEHGPALRLRAARLRHGETAICAGVLRRGYNPRGSGSYRAAEGGWVLVRPPGREGMWVSGGSLAAELGRKASRLWAYAGYLGALVVVVHLAFLPIYRMALSAPERCTVTGVVSPPRPLSGGPQVVGACEAGPPLAEPARRELVELVEGSEEVTVTRVRAGSETLLGPVPTLSWARLALVLSVALAGLLAVGLAVGRGGRSWYEARPFVEKA
jgi:F0F1-type ATP synthase membrane subunit c/vacuolar-type H+-ATPase subunit K